MTIYTWGYSGRQPAELVDLAQQHDAIVMDIRYSPRSRASQWSGGALRKLLGDRYTHCPALGNVAYKSGGPIQLADPEHGVRDISQLLATGHAVILLCVCKDHQTCHRSTAAAILARQLGLEVKHL